MDEHKKDYTVGGPTAVIDRPNDLPAIAPEQSLIVPEPSVNVSQRIIDDVNSAGMQPQVQEQPSGETPEYKSPHARIRERTLQEMSGLAPDQQGWAAVKTALKTYDQEMGKGKDPDGNDVSFPVYQREYRRLRQKLYTPFIKSAMDSGAQRIDETSLDHLRENRSERSDLQKALKTEWSVMSSPVLMKEAARDDVLRRMLIKEAGARIDAKASDPVDAAYYKQHLIKKIYDQAKTVPSIDGGVTADWAKRAIRAEQRKSVLAMLATPESTAQAVAKAQEWIAQEKTAIDLPADVTSGRAELGKAILRIKGEQEKKAAKIAAKEKFDNDPRRVAWVQSQDVAKNEIANNTVASSGLDPLRPTGGFNSLTTPTVSHTPEGFMAPNPIVAESLAPDVTIDQDAPLEPQNQQSSVASSAEDLTRLRAEAQNYTPLQVEQGKPTFDRVRAEQAQANLSSNDVMQANIAAHIKRDAESGRTQDIEEKRKKIDEELARFLKEHPRKTGPGVKARLSGFFDRNALGIVTVSPLVVAAGVGVPMAALQMTEHDSSSSSSSIPAQEQVVTNMPSQMGIGNEENNVIPIDVAAIKASESAPVTPEPKVASEPAFVMPAAVDVASPFVGTGSDTSSDTGAQIDVGGSAISEVGGETDSSAAEITTSPDAPVEQESTEYVFQEGETWGAKRAGSQDPQVVNAWLNNPANLDTIEADLILNAGENGLPTVAEIRKTFDDIRAGSVPISAGWSALNTVTAGKSYSMASTEDINDMDTDRDGFYSDHGYVLATEAVVPSSPQPVTSNDATAEAPVGSTDPSQSVGAESSELGKPPAISFGRRLASVFRRR